MNVADKMADRLARDLVQLLSGMMGIHRELAMHMREKLEAIKVADSDRMHSITAREMLLADRLREREGLRKQLTRRLMQELSIEVDPSMKLTALAERFPEPRRSQLLVTASGLRESLGQVEQLRVTTALISQEMLKHLAEVMAVMKGGVGGVDVYSRSGQRERAGVACVFEAVG